MTSASTPRSPVQDHAQNLADPQAAANDYVVPVKLPHLAELAEGESVIKYKSPLNTQTQTQTIIAVIEHVRLGGAGSDGRQRRRPERDPGQGSRSETTMRPNPFRNRGTEFVSESGIKWMGGNTKWQCDQNLLVAPSHGCFVRPLIHFIPESLSILVPVF
jgi:hypothetical protein